MRRFLVASVALCALLFVMTNSTLAAPVTNRGLSISPLRLFIDGAAGNTVSGTILVGNMTSQPMNIALSVEQFSVADYTYDFQFSQAKENWITLDPTSVTLAPGKTQTIAYHLAVPEHASPGGHYFTIFASTSLDTEREERVATVLYVTVAGELVRSSTVSHESIPTFVFGGDIRFSFDVKNTGNTHYFMYTSGKLSGLSAQPPSSEVAHIFLPQTIRTVTGSISAPILPGVYAASYGYRTEDGQHINRSALIVYLPLWVWPLLAGIVWIGSVLLKRRKHMRLSK